MRYRVSSLRVVQFPRGRRAQAHQGRHADARHVLSVLVLRPGARSTRRQGDTRIAESIPDAKPVPVSWPREQPRAPVVERPALPGRASASVPTLRSEPKSLREGNDVALVRQAIERFRMTYNARFTSHGEERAGGPLTFQNCRVNLDADSATVTCQSAAAPADTLDVLERTFSLRKLGGAWAIKSFSMLP